MCLLNPSRLYRYKYSNIQLTMAMRGRHKLSRIMQQNVTKCVYPFSTSCLHLYFILMNTTRIDSNYLGKKAQQAHFLAPARPLLRSVVALATLYLLVLHASYPLRAQQIDSLLRLGQMDAAIRMSDSIIASRKASPEEKFNAFIAGGYSASLIYRTNNPISLPYFFKALEIAQSLNQYPWECQALAFIGSYYVRCLHQPALGLQYHEQARQIALMHNDSAILAGAHNNLGVIYSENYHDSLALLHFTKALALSNEEAGGQYAAENNIGAVLMRDEKYQEAISYFLLAQSHMERNNITANMALSFKNIGECYLRMGDFTTAESWANRCLHLAQETNDTAFQVYSLLLLFRHRPRGKPIPFSTRILPKGSQLGTPYQLRNAPILLLRFAQQTHGAYRPFSTSLIAPTSTSHHTRLHRARREAHTN